jgi:polysaccharide pyruvyl transferase WcaK-like protein
LEAAADKVKSHLHIIEEDYNLHELKALIGRCDFFMGSRMHACIAALSQCVPAAGLAYSRKFRGVFASIGMEDFALDLREHDGNSVIELVDRVYKRKLQLHKELEAKMPAVKAQILNLFDKLTFVTDT